MKTNAGFQEDDSTSIKYSNRPFDISQVELALGKNILLEIFLKYLLRTINIVNKVINMIIFLHHTYERDSKTSASIVQSNKM